MAHKTEDQAFSTNALDKSTQFIEKNKKIFIGVLIGIIVVIAGIYSYVNFISKPRAEKASDLLSKGQNYFAAGNFDVALNGDNTDFRGFLDIAKRYSGTKAGNLANLYAGLSYAQKGDAKDALTYLDKYDEKGDRLISPAVVSARGNCYAQLGQIDKAISLLKKAAAEADNNSLSPIFLIQAGELLESQNKTDEALKLYQEVKQKYPKAPYAESIDKYIQRVSK